MEKRSKFEKLLLEVYYQGMADEKNNKDNFEYLNQAYVLGQTKSLYSSIHKNMETLSEEQIIDKILLKD